MGNMQYFIFQLLIPSFWAILFLQSGLDKVIDWKGNLDWLKGHFSKTPLKNLVPMMLLGITFMEVSSGVISLAGIIEMLAYNTKHFAAIGAILSALSLLMLFFGQRIAKDYAGAATLVPYFMLALWSIAWLRA
ncbi:MAG: DoxX family protein [Cytophagales bacterium]|nr:MAG: DoxX family protein [Cytophagales bacterium]